MGATTKKGRTRNRRAIAESAPTAAYPLMMAVQGLERTSAPVLKFTVRNTNGSPYPYTSFAGSGVVSVYSDPDGGVISATVAYNSGTDTWTITKAGTWEIDEFYVLGPWQPNLRGLNGEWFAPAVLVPRL